MVEIAIAVAVIAFALVAIVGLLPLGMETQRDNREETVINQDATYLLEAIRGGATNLYDLTNFVDRLMVAGVIQRFTNSADVIRALTTVNTTNEAIMRSISGAASLRSPAVQDLAMRYKVVAQVFRAEYLRNVDVAAQDYRTIASSNLFEVRLAFYWPAGPPLSYTVSDTARRQVFRTLVSGSLDPGGFLNSSVFVKP